ncbi:MAG: KOW motif-containing protein, partial [Muribaculaceae bacterium]|nr:KOW motif-containing protein [Muribaculaceae bacterium]
LVYLNPEPGDFSQGDRVRILGGPFEGAEGVFVRVKGDRRVVVHIEGVVAVATTFIHPSLIEKI